MSSIEVRRIDDPPAVRLALSGELDIAATDEVERHLQEAEDGEPEVLVLDLRALTFMDSTGLRMILGADTRAREAGRRCVVIPGPEPVHRVFRLALLEDRLEFEAPAAEET